MSDLRNQSAYSYPSPATNTLPRTDISLREILDTYRDNNELLKQILNAKAEEDKRRSEEEKYKTEQIRLQCKQVELEMLKEQKKPPTIFTGVPPINTSTPGFNVKSPSDVHSPYLTMPPPIDGHFPATTPTSATPRLSPPSSANTGHDYNGISNSHNHSYSPMSQRPSLTLSIPPFLTASPTTMHNNHSFSTPTSSIQEHPHSATSQSHHHYSQSPTSMNSNNKRTKLSSESSEVDHEYVMEALRQKVQRNQENPAKKFMTVLKPKSASMPVPPLNSPQQPNHSSHHHNHHHHHHQHHHNNRDQHKQQSPHQRQHQSQPPSAPSPVDPAHSPLPPQLPPMNVHSPSMNQEQVAKT